MFLENTQGKWLQYRITAACGAGFLLFGYEQGIFGGLLDNEAFLETFGNPSVTIQGQIVATYDIGCIIGTLVSMFAGDTLCRRWSILIGCCILVVGAISQTASYPLGLISSRADDSRSMIARTKIISDLARTEKDHSDDEHCENVPCIVLCSIVLKVHQSTECP